MSDTHTHGPGDGHSHGYREATVVEPSADTLMIRIVMTVLGAAGMIVGAFLNWIGGTASAGTTAPYAVFWSTSADEAGFLASAGAVIILLGLLALLGLAFQSGWLTRLAGGLGLVAMTMFVITIYRAGGSFGDLGPGFWLIVVGSLVSLIGGFLGTRTVVVT